jgi:DNA-binding protein
MAPENTIFIGKKGTMAYVLAAVTQMNQNGSDKVILKARGRAISKAVDVAEIVRNKFVTDVKVDKIDISTEEVSGEEGNTLKVSAIEIFMKK